MFCRNIYFRSLTSAFVRATIRPTKEKKHVQLQDIQKKVRGFALTSNK